MFERAIALLDAADDTIGLGAALYWHAYHTGSTATLERAIENAEATGNGFLLGWSLFHKAAILTQQGHPIDERHAPLARVEAIGEQAGLPVIRAVAVMQRIAGHHLELAANGSGHTVAELQDLADEAESVMRRSGRTQLWNPQRHHLPPATTSHRLRTVVGRPRVLVTGERFEMIRTHALDLVRRRGAATRLDPGADVLDRRRLSVR